MGAENFDPAFLIELTIGLIVTGAASGLLAGLLGVGGGIVIVPVLFLVLDLLSFPPETAMHMAVATSLGTIIPTSLSSMRAHNKRGSLDWELFRRWGPFLAAGAALGGFVSRYLDGEMLKTIFGVIALLVAINMASPKKLLLGETLPVSSLIQRAMAGAIGLFSSLMGIGGGTLSVPVLSAFSFPIHRAVGTASAFGLVIALPAVAGFIWGGWGVEGRPPYSLGYLNIPAACIIFPCTVLTAPLGAKLAHSLRAGGLRLAFAAFLAITAVRMLIAAFG